jgi:hypothetical protein
MPGGGRSIGCQGVWGSIWDEGNQDRKSDVVEWTDTRLVGSSGGSPNAPVWTMIDFQPYCESRHCPRRADSDPVPGLACAQVDVNNVFLHDTLTEMVYCRSAANPPASLTPLTRMPTQQVLILKQVPRTWYHRSTSYLVSIAFVEAKSDTSLSVYRRGSDTVYLLLYVDDIVFILHRLTPGASTAYHYNPPTGVRHEGPGPLYHFLASSWSRDTMTSSCTSSSTL